MGLYQQRFVLAATAMFWLCGCDDPSLARVPDKDPNVEVDDGQYADVIYPNSTIYRENTYQGPLLKGPPYPIVMVHGFSGFTRLGPLEYFFQVLEKLAEDGEEQIYPAALPPYNSIEERAPYLGAFVDGVLEQTQAEKVHIVAHSQGGLDSRHLLVGLGYHNRVATLTTIATPHRGSPLADYIVALPPDTLDPVAITLAWLIGALEDPEATPEGDEWRSDMDASAASLTTQALENFNRNHPDPDNVPIFSYAGVSNLQYADSICGDSQLGELQRADIIDPLLVAPAAVLSGLNPLDLTPNDGIVTTESMVWGHFVGCIPADHFDQIGQIADMVPHVVSGFNHINFYRKIVSDIRQWEDNHHSSTAE